MKRVVSLIGGKSLDCVKTPKNPKQQRNKIVKRNPNNFFIRYFNAYSV